MHKDLARFRFCPECRADALSVQQDKAIICGECDFRYFHNTAVAVAAVICVDDHILLARRAFDPGAGLLDFPGGFVDPAESLEEASSRELAEELDLEIPVHRWVYLFSQPNRYPFDGIVYRTCDAFLGVQLAERPPLQARDDVSATRWMRPQEVQPQELAFSGLPGALRRLNAGALEKVRSGHT